METSLVDKVFIVVGGASGMGLATTKILLARGASVGISDINAEALEVAAKSHNTEKLLAEVVDVRDRAAVQRFFAATKSKFGRVDGVVNCAGTGGPKMGTAFWELETSDYEFVMAVNSTGIFNTTAEALQPGFLQTPASIVNVGSMFSERGFARAAPYCASKHAVVGLTKTAAIEAASLDIRVNAVLPGSVDTPLFHDCTPKFPQVPNSDAPMKRVADPKEIGLAIAFLLSNESSFITGAVWNVDGGANA